MDKSILFEEHFLFWLLDFIDFDDMIFNDPDNS